MSTKKPSEAEEEYVARQEAETRHRLAAETMHKMAAAEREALRKAHWRHCPNCGYNLEDMTFKDLTIQRCHNCHGTWLDEGSLEHLAGKEPRFFQRLLSVFKR